ncbi:uncharacterized protein N7483_005377 [Penicillium malachiteum]|uniref:uncharacterized protein n=1 Tax=Penicillium malachiteum TaxID=1324776 RepID=UPI002547B4BF|nr:uncharacterized protein N7483_005377 [Penicillium malachiteum]KAJ5730869.1 hypothetical protein N7483_005377 [Penicillium malachiteum]
MSLNNPTQPISYSSAQPETSHEISSPRAEDIHPQEDQEQTTDHVTSPHGTAEEPGTAAEAHDATTQPATFQPFFTLIEDTQLGEYRHPTVHYIFSDDDIDIITAAALRSLETQQDALSSSKKEELHIEEHGTPEQEKSSLLPPPIPGVRENYLVLDVEPVPAPENTITPIPTQPTGLQSPLGAVAGASVPPQFRVTSAKSFSPTWQVLQSEISPAPTFENDAVGETGGHGFMLKIQGTGGLPYISDSGKETGPRRLEEMMDQFAKRMAELQTIIDAEEVASTKIQDEVDQEEEKEKGKDKSEGLTEDAPPGDTDEKDAVDQQLQI